MTSGLTYASRTVVYLIKMVVIALAIAAVMYFAFNFASEATTCYMLVKEGLTMREDVVINKDSSADLNKLFTEKFLDNDTLLKSTAYRNYDKLRYYSDIELDGITGLWVDLLKGTATIRVSEKVWYINGDLILEEGEQKPENTDPPVWDSARYQVFLRRINGDWKITEMKKLNDLLLPTPTPSPTPSVTPTVTPDEAPSASPSITPSADVE